MKKNIIYYSTKSLLLILSFILLTSSIFANDEILRAMRDEISRTMNELKVESLQKPYYVEYKLTVAQNVEYKCTLGDYVEKSDYPSAYLTVGIRVGNYDFDNTNYFDFGLSFFGSGDDEESFRNRRMPLDLNYDAVRRELWLATDAAYKRAVEIFSKKEAALKNRVRKDTVPDYLKVAPAKNLSFKPIPAMDNANLGELARSASAIFIKYAEINVSSVGLEYAPQTVYFINSEGMEYITTSSYCGLEIVAASQAADGMPVTTHFAAYGLSPLDLPDKDSVLRAAKAVAESIKLQMAAKELDEPYSGPILFTEQAAAEVFAQVFAPNLAAQREQMTETGTQDNDRYTAFQNKIGGRVLPEFLEVYDEPSKQKFEKTPLVGFYKIDDEGIKAEDVKLVDGGYLKALLSSRTPTRRVKTTNGHCRLGAPMYSNLFLVEDKSEKSKALTDKALAQKMIEMLKARELEYGIIVTKVLNQNIMYTTLFSLLSGDFQTLQKSKTIIATEAYKVFQDGRKELVRGCEIAGLSPQSFKDIINIGAKPYSLNLLAPSITSSYISGGSPYVHASVTVPSLLFEDGEVKPITDDFPKPPILNNPLGK